MLTYRGSVNRWECDENDHMNVRYCVEKLYETFCRRFDNDQQLRRSRE